jgi:hypothetical protein
MTLWRRLRRRLPRNQWQAGGQALAMAMRLVPHSRRFDVAVYVARALEPLVARTRAFRVRSSTRTDGLREITLDLVLMMLTDYGTGFDPKTRLERAELLEAALSAGRGVLIVGPHTLLCRALVRHLYDRGQEPTTIAADPMRIVGTSAPCRNLLPSPMLLVRAHNALRARKILCAFVDRADEADASVRRIDTPDGPMWIADALLRLAKRTGASLLFFASYVDRAGEVVIEFGAPRASASLDAVMDDFGVFVRDYMEQRRRARS